MVKVKICGLTREEDISMVNLHMPDYVGFVFAESKRRVDKYRGKRLIELLHKDIKKVGVFVNSTPQEINEIADYCKLDIIQLHGDETPDDCNRIQQKVWKAFRMRKGENLHGIDQYQVEGYLFDAYQEDSFGGTGISFDWKLLKNMSLERKIILAGGITPDNVQRGIEFVHPHVVDVSSGVELEGRKDLSKIKTLLERVRELES